MRIGTFALLFLLFTHYNLCFSQSIRPDNQIQDSLAKLSTSIWKQKTEAERLTRSEVFFTTLQSVLLSNNNSDVSLDSIPGITYAASDDKKICIYTWNIPLIDGSNKYYGFIRLNEDSIIVIPLSSVQDVSDNFSSATFTPQNWYGALYYKLIEVKSEGKTIYTLLGWDGFTKDANRKLIDILTVTPDLKVVFGMPLFKTEKGIKSRVVKEYAEKASMLLRYDYQAIRVEKRKKIKKVEKWLIVMDRLVPMDPSMKGISRYYVPSGDTYDGYLFMDNYWVLIEDVDVMNKEVKK